VKKKSGHLTRFLCVNTEVVVLL